MLDLTDKQKEDCEKAINRIRRYVRDTLELKMQSVSFETALAEIMGNILHGEGHS